MTDGTDDTIPESIEETETVYTCFFESPLLRTHRDACQYLGGEYAATLKALVDVLGGKGSLHGMYLEDLADVAESLASFLRESEPSPMRFQADESFEYVAQLTEAVEAVKNNAEGVLDTSLPLLSRVLLRARLLQAQELDARLALGRA